MNTAVHHYVEDREPTVLPPDPNFDAWLDPDTTAVVCIDMHRGHVGPEEQLTCPVPRAREKIAVHNAFHAACREIGIPIIMAQLFWRRPGRAMPRPPAPLNADLLYPLYMPENPIAAEHSREGSKWLDLMVEFDDDLDYRILTKKRYSAFHPTDLEFLLRRLGVENIVITGTMTEACVLSTAFDAANRDFRVVVPRDIVAGYSEESEHAALLVVALHLGLVVESPELLAEWYARKDQTVPRSVVSERRT